MAISDEQLEVWSHQGAVQGSSTTYQAIKRVLESDNAAYSQNSYEVFLQGSYRNDTNIYAESDVDIVIRLDDCFHSDQESLTEAERNAWSAAHNDATYTDASFKRDVVRVLADSFGNSFDVGDKAIFIEPNGVLRKADVLVATAFRRYHKFNGLHDQRYDEGICFFNANGERIANYPKQHSTNLTVKHQGTDSWLKPMIRILKNLRSKLIDEQAVKAGSVPSYYIEGLLYNVPDDKFGRSFHDCFVNAFGWIQGADKTQFVCANQQYYLLRDNAHTCWATADGQAFINAAIELWNTW